jgi:tRNA-splicing ligase RtcB (3'-phosphate/5'-hydroxy nucleic acid ligase)
MPKITDFKEITPYLWEIPQTYNKNMLVPARVYASAAMLTDILQEKAIEQLINTASLPGIAKYALAMPDIHQGYGFPIGGVAAMRAPDGVISPGGVGYDINCGVRLLATPYRHEEIKDKIPKLASQMQRDIPSGVGRGGDIMLTQRQFDTMLNQGVSWVIKQGYATHEDALNTEEHGHYKAANADLVSEQAKQRGANQLGTLGAGNHFIEIQEVVTIYDYKIAEIFGIFTGQITVMIHTGSRGLGHQVCTDYVSLMNKKISEFKINLPDRELACAPFNSSAGQEYWQAMAAAANFAWVNRQIITDLARKAWSQVLGNTRNHLQVVYDVAHNIAKLEKHNNKSYIVHRKGATRAFGPNHPEIPEKYQTTGQPVFIPGSMGTNSYILSGTEEAMENTFGSACHGAGRKMSRFKAKKNISYNHLLAELEQYGVIIRANSMKGLLEEAPEAYKDVNAVVDVVSNANIARKVAKLKPVAIIKG